MLFETLNIFEKSQERLIYILHYIYDATCLFEINGNDADCERLFVYIIQNAIQTVYITIHLKNGPAYL